MGKDDRQRRLAGNRATGLSEGNRQSAALLVFLAAVALACLVVAVFYPVLGFQFVEYDVSEQVVNNPYIRGLSWENLAHIFTSRCIYSYYPFRTLTFAVDYQIWGLHPAGFELTNLLIHLANVLLVFWLVLRLSARDRIAGQRAFKEWRRASLAAAFAAGLFAVHPVVVEPVAWICGREELLVTLGALACFHFHLTAQAREKMGTGPEKAGHFPAKAAYGEASVPIGSPIPRARQQAGTSGRWAWGWRVAAMVCCAAACLSNAVGAVIPLLLTAWDLIRLPRPSARVILRDSVALWAVGLATILLKRFDPDSGQLLRAEAGLLSLDRLALIFNVYAENLRHLAWPVNLVCDFGWVRPASFLSPGVILGGIAAGLTCLVLWAFRHRRMVLLGLVWFLVALAPTSQILPHHIHRADRFLYLPLVGLAIAVAMALGGRFPTALARRSPWQWDLSGCGGERERSGEWKQHLGPQGPIFVSRGGIAGTLGAAAAILVLLGVISHRQTYVWRDDLTLWTSALRVHPENPVAHSSLARYLVHQGKFDEAIEHYEAALRADPDNIAAVNNYAILLATCADEHFRNYARAVELAERGWRITKGTDPDLRYTLALASMQQAGQSAASGRTAEAMRRYARAIEAVPDCHEAMANLAFLLATCAEETLRDPARAVTLAQRSCALAGKPDAYHLSILAAACAAAGRFDDAVAAISAAIQSAQQSGDPRLAAELQRQSDLYRKRMPYRAPR